MQIIFVFNSYRHLVYLFHTVEWNEFEIVFAQMGIACKQFFLVRLTKYTHVLTMQINQLKRKMLSLFIQIYLLICVLWLRSRMYT